jgi:hypothetical protein
MISMHVVCEMYDVPKYRVKKASSWCQNSLLNVKELCVSPALLLITPCVLQNN